MPRLVEPSAEDLATHQAWLESRPPAIRAVAERLDPWKLYRLRTTGQIVGLYSLSEADPPKYPTVTATVTVLREYSVIPMPDFQVFGIDPDDLAPYEPPSMAAPAPPD
jgi:hypothetical protein